MQKLLIVFFVCLLILCLLFLPFKARVMGHFNLIKKQGFYSFKVWKLKILCGEVYLNENNKIIIENQNNIIKDHYKDEYFKRFSKNMLKRINVDKIEIFTNFGLKNNAFVLAIISGVVASVIQVFYSILSNKYKNVVLYEDICSEFCENRCELYGDVVISINLASTILCALKSIK